VRRTGEKLPDPILIDEDDKFLINRLLEKKNLKGKIEYLVK
jgi:hypothetical protein